MPLGEETNSSKIYTPEAYIVETNKGPGTSFTPCRDNGVMEAMSCKRDPKTGKGKDSLEEPWRQERRGLTLSLPTNIEKRRPPQPPLTEEEKRLLPITAALKLGGMVKDLDYYTMGLKNSMEEERVSLPRNLALLVTGAVSGNVLGVAGQTFKIIRGDGIDSKVPSQFAETLFHANVISQERYGAAAQRSDFKLDKNQLWLLRFLVIIKSYKVANALVKESRGITPKTPEDICLDYLARITQLDQIIRLLPLGITDAKPSSILLSKLLHLEESSEKVTTQNEPKDNKPKGKP